MTREAVRILAKRTKRTPRYLSGQCKYGRHEICDGRAYARANAVADHPCACSCHTTRTTDDQGEEHG